MNNEDICTHLGDHRDKLYGEVIPPIFMTTIFSDIEREYESYHGGKYGYSRRNNPTSEIAEEKIAALEKGESAICLSAGMAAISCSLFNSLASGDHLIYVRNAYVITNAILETYLKKFGIESTRVRGDDITEIENSIKPNTKVIYLESPSSCIFEMQDLKQISGIAKSRNIRTIIDNTWATPIFQNPLDSGIDIVVHSATKYLGGHSDIVGGAIIANRQIIDSIRNNERAMFGSIMAPFQAWLLVRGIRTLPLRMKQHQENAMKVAKFLENHTKIKKTIYPGLKSHPQYELGRKQMHGYSGLMSFVPFGDVKSINGFLKSLKYIHNTASWGGFESIICPIGLGIDEKASIERNIPVNLIRLSVGLENPDTIIQDLNDGTKLL